MVYDDHTELTPLDAAELAAVLGGFSWQAVLQGALQGALGGASQGGQGGDFFRSALSGGIMGFAQALVGQINAGGSPAPQPSPGPLPGPKPDPGPAPAPAPGP